MKTTQKQKVLEYIKQYGSITRAEAFIDLGIAELAARICELKRDGYNISGDTIEVKTRLGEVKRVTKYTLTEDIA